MSCSPTGGRSTSYCRQIIDERTDFWGVEISAVEIKDVQLPESMRRAIARQAEAERERRAKVINAQGELQASETLAEAARVMSTPAGVAAATLPADGHRDRGREQLDDDLPGPDRHAERILQAACRRCGARRGQCPAGRRTTGEHERERDRARSTPLPPADPAERTAPDLESAPPDNPPSDLGIGVVSRTKGVRLLRNHLRARRDRLSTALPL